MKQHTVTSTQYRTGSTSSFTGTIPELIQTFSYTLECGASYEGERNNVKINRNPKTIKSLIGALNKAVANSAANGSASQYYS